MSGGITVKEFKHIPGKNDAEYIKLLEEHSERWKQIANSAISKLKRMSAERPEIIRCKDCKHWNLQVGNVKGDGLGSCDFHNVNFVTGEGFCYWADRRGGSDGTD